MEKTAFKPESLLIFLTLGKGKSLTELIPRYFTPRMASGIYWRLSDIFQSLIVLSAHTKTRSD